MRRGLALAAGALTLAIVVAVAAGCGEAASSGPPEDAAVPADASVVTPRMPSIPPHVQLVHAAYGVGAVRLCFASDTNAAEPRDVVVPRTNYPGLVPGGAAGVAVERAPSAPFLADAWKLALVEQLPDPPITLPCMSVSQLASVVDEVALAPVVLPARPALLALVGCAPDAGVPAAACGPTPGLALSPIALSDELPEAGAADIVMLSRTLSKSVSFGFGPLGTCPASRLPLPSFGGMVSVRPFASPTGSYETEGLVVCDASGRVQHEWSFLAIEVAGAPATTPGDFWDRRVLYVLAIVGEDGLAPPLAPHAVALAYEVTR